MNSKLCKLLRRRAEKATVGYPVRSLIFEKNRMINHPLTTRHYYRDMKAIIKGVMKC